MKRSGFTMVELIFVIIVIGILAAIAIPKFGDIRDRAKVNAEYASLSGLDGTITAEMEFRREDSDGADINVTWHNTDSGDPATTYDTINDNKKVLSKILKKGEKLKIVAYVDVNVDGNATDSDIAYDVIFIEGQASNSATGVEKTTDTAGRPDRNDVWVFNTSPVSATITTYDGGSTVTTTVASGEIKLIDITASTDTKINYMNSGGTPDSSDDLSISVGGSSLATIVEL